MILQEKTKNRIVLLTSIMLLSFGMFNLSANIYGQNSTSETAEIYEKTTDSWEPVYQSMVEQLFTTVMPILVGSLSAIIQYGRTKGLQISKEAEDYITSTAQSIVETQGRHLFDNAYKEKDLLISWSTGKLDKNGEDKLNNFFKNAKNNAVTALETELKSSKFKKAAGNIVKDNLDAIIEKAYTATEIKKSERTKKLLGELSSLAIDSALLYYDKKNLSKEDKAKIIEKGVKIIAKNFTFESLVLNDANAKMYLEAELSNKIES